MMRRPLLLPLLIFAIAAAAIPACKSRPSNADTAMNMRPFEEPTYGSSVPIEDAKAVTEAMEAARSGHKLVKLPLYLVRGSDPLRSYEKAYIAVEPTPRGGAQFDLVVTDFALGVSLADRMRQYCPATEACCLWVVGYIQDEGGPLAKSGNGTPLSLRAVLGKYKPEDPRLLYVEKGN